MERFNGIAPQQDAGGYADSYAITDDGYDKLHISIIFRRAKQHTSSNSE
jgi:hypothetical protein